MNQPPSPAPITQLIFYLLVLSPFVILIFRIAKRKGRSGWFAALGAVPVVNMFVAIWLASLPEARLLREIEELKRRVGGTQS